LQKWVCQDYNLVWVNNTYVYGTTSHFTAFAIIVSPEGNPQHYQPGPSPVSAGLYAGVIVAGVVVAVVGVFVLVFWLRRRERQTDYQKRRNTVEFEDNMQMDI